MRTKILPKLCRWPFCCIFLCACSSRPIQVTISVRPLQRLLLLGAHVLDTHIVFVSPSFFIYRLHIYSHLFKRCGNSARKCLRLVNLDFLQRCLAFEPSLMKYWSFTLINNNKLSLFIQDENVMIVKGCLLNIISFIC